jgi:hypothetical protein
VSADAGPILGVILSTLANPWEIVVRTQHTSAEPHCVALHDVLAYVAGDAVLSASHCVVGFHALVESLLELFLEATVEVLEERTAS